MQRGKNFVSDPYATIDATSTQSLLIIDDDRHLLPVLKDSLHFLTDMRIYAAANGPDGLELFYRVRPTCVIVDVVLKEGGMDGYQVVQALRGDRQTASTPIIFLSARQEDVSRFTGLAVGGDNYLMKPVPINILVGAIEKAIATSDAERRQRLQILAESEPPRSSQD